MKGKKCDGCKALRQSDNSCELGYEQETYRSLNVGFTIVYLKRCVGGCPKPKTITEYNLQMQLHR